MAKRSIDFDPQLLRDWACRHSLGDAERQLLEAVVSGHRGRELTGRVDGPVAELEMAFARATGVSVYSVAKDLLARERLARER